jgi:subtilisin family serine protease
MRLLATLLTATLASTAAARPLLVGRVGMILRDEMPSRALAQTHADERALVTARAKHGADALRLAGFDAQPLAGDVAMVRVTSEELRRLARLPDVVAIEERRLLYPLLDVSGPMVGAPAARAETGLDGSGVLIATVDTGLDFRHADFRKADGMTRVAAILDLANPRGTLHPEIADYAGGAVWLRSDIDAVLLAEAAGMSPSQPVLEKDTLGHGTHVAGIAASNGLATGHGLPAGRYVGMAPGAGLLIAQASRAGNSFSDADFIAACRFVVDQATALGRPFVLNVSLGGPGGGHDGTSNLEVALDALFPEGQPGRALVVAAGNNGALDQHAGAWALDGDADVALSVPTSAQPDAQLAIELWYTGALSIAVETPSGRSVDPVAQGASGDSGSTDAGRILIDNGASSPPRADGRQAATIALIGNPGLAPIAGTWKLHLRGRAVRWDAWMTEVPASGGSARFVDHIAEDDRLSLPATARNAIVVGSFISRNSWKKVDGSSVTDALELGSPSSFSSMGPTADGRFAPDLLAPGEYVISALSMDAPPTTTQSDFFVGPSDPSFAWADDGVHGVLCGTSQAAPHVAGAVALLLQANPMLTPANLREILRTAAKDGGHGFSPRQGFGALDVLAALRSARGIRGTQVSATASSVGLSRDLVPPGDQTTTVSVTPRSADGVPLGAGHQVTIRTSAGSPVGATVDAGFGRYEQAIEAHATAGTVATVTAVVDGVVLAAHPSIYFVRSRSEVGRPFAAGGGCALSMASTVPYGGLLVLALALVPALVLSPRLRRSRRLWR